MSRFNASNLNQTAQNTHNISELYRLVDVDVNEATSVNTNPCLEIATYTPGTAQVETATAEGTVTANPGGTAIITVTAANMTGSPKDVNVPLLLNDDASAIAEKIRTALAADATVNAFFDISGETDKVILTAKTPAKYDVTMNCRISAGTATGVTEKISSANTTKGTKDEIVHPSILFFPNGWNGYKYWLGYTCYDNGSDVWENPCLAVSNDNVTWITPPGLTNPVEPRPAEGYNADIHLFMSPDEKTMYMCFKWDYNTTRSLYLRSSTDGITWTPKVKLFGNDENIINCLSPGVLWDGNQYKMWTVTQGATPDLNVICIRTASNPYGPWTEPVECTSVLPSGVGPWHLDVRKLGNQYHMLLTAKQGSKNIPYFGKSNDGLSWTFCDTGLHLDAASEATGLYKHTMFPMMTHEGIKYGVWMGTAVPYYLFYTTLSFNKSKIAYDGNKNVMEAIYGVGDWIFCDTFNRADTTEGLGTPDKTPDTGVDWLSVAGNVMGIASGKAYLPVAANSKSVVDLKTADYYVEVSVPVLGTSGYIIVRYTDATNYWLWGYSSAGDVLYYKKATAGNSFGYTNSRLVAGDRFGISVKGDVFTVYQNGLPVYTLTDATGNTATKAGINLDNITTRFDNFIAKSI